MRLFFLTTALYAFLSSGAPLPSNGDIVLSAANEAKAVHNADILKAIIPSLQKIVTAHPQVGFNLAKAVPVFATNDATPTFDFVKIRTVAEQLSKGAPSQDIAGGLLSLLTALPGAIWDGVSGILSMEWSLISGIFSGLFGWLF